MQALVCPEAEKQINDQPVTDMTFSLWACHYISKQLSFNMILRAFFATISKEGSFNQTNVKWAHSGAMKSHSYWKSLKTLSKML